MSDWTERKQIAIPVSHKEEANAVAAVLDPDIGGDQTFRGEATHSADGTAPATHLVAHTQLLQGTYRLLAEGTTEEILAEVMEDGDTGLDRATLETVVGALEIEAGYEEALPEGDETEPELLG